MVFFCRDNSVSTSQSLSRAMLSAAGRGRGRAALLENGPPAPLRRPRERTSNAAGGAAGGAGEPALPQPQQLRRPGAPPAAAATAAHGVPEPAPLPVTRPAETVPGLNPHSVPFVPAAPSLEGTISTPDFSEWESDSEAESYTVAESESVEVNSALVTEVPPPQDPYQSMIYNNLAETLWSMACVPASFDRQGSVLVENLNGWLPSSGIPLSTVLDFMLNQVAYVPSFRYVCAKLCHLMCSRCRVTQEGRSFRDLLLSRCQSLYQNASSLLTENVQFFCDLTVLFCELYLHVRLAGGEEPIAVLGSAVLGLCGQLLDDVTPERVTTVCRALKLTGAALERQVAPALDALMERVRGAAFDGRLPRDQRHALLELTTLRAAHWGGGERPAAAAAQAGLAAAEASRPLQGYLPADPTSALSSEEQLFLERQLQAVDDDDDDEVDDAYDAFLEELDRRR
ncbi:polyadenylate-binding protein-interacting protein 1-like isoform X3 [Amphibalanus amphitrite]|uniref:polyadenylate-binding protein-interacting protein 1-like isoform X3 n=1 Tax=Amphibalanus amphitrite TaxID=1232801 RepID=UPI001C90BCF2|nr:polyadenylate-binding protein-interacting protein 1-like isoform X3 [Amphibalanus amphitrite]